MIRSLLAAVAVLAIHAGAAGAQGGASAAQDGAAARGGPAADSAEVIATIAAFHTALETGDSAAALALLAPDVQVLESGGVETLDEYRAHHLPADIAFARGVPSERQVLAVTIADSVAWVASTSRTRGSWKGREIDSSGAELMVLTRAPSGWLIRAIHWSSRARRSG
jgi:ketosteroid isomerase-like protein